jgi:hypothetical protein
MPRRPSRITLPGTPGGAGGSAGCSGPKPHYLLSVPAGRTRLLAVKFGVIVTFDSLLRTPVDTSTLLKGLLSFGVYAVLFGSFAWARFTSADVTS